MAVLRIVAGAVLALSLWGCGSTGTGEVGSSVEAVCCGLTCCNVGGTCLNTGDLYMGDPCLVCMPDNDRFAPTDICGEGDAGMGGSGGDGGSGVGGGDGGSGGDGGGCSVGSQRPSHSPAWLLAAVGLCLTVRRRSRLRS